MPGRITKVCEIASLAQHVLRNTIRSAAICKDFFINKPIAASNVFSAVVIPWDFFAISCEISRSILLLIR